MSQLRTTKALGFQAITSLAAATGLTPPKGATLALIKVEGQPVRWRDDGVAPTASVGNLLSVGETLKYDAYSQTTQNLAPIQFIQTAASASLTVSYYE